MTNAEKLEYAFKSLDDTKKYLNDAYFFLCPARYKKEPCYICDRIDLDYLKDELEYLLKLLKEENAT